MSDEAPRERAPGWVLLGAGVFLGVAVPTWLILTVAVIQLSPDLNGLGGDELRTPTLGVWIAGGMSSATALGILGVALAAVLGGAAAVAAVGRRRAAAERRRLDALVADDAVIDAEGWADADPKAADG